MNAQPKFKHPELTSLPGEDGCLYRFFEFFDDAAVTKWMADEIRAGTRPEFLGAALGRALAAMTMQFAKQTSDPSAAIAGKFGVVKAYEQSINALAKQHVGAKKNGIIIPPRVHN